MPSILCLSRSLTTGGSSFPLFIGFSTAAELAELAEAPAFTPTTPHSDLCVNILTPPVKDWQRPLDSERIGKIAQVYSAPGEIMPNPVLLCQSPTQPSNAITLKQVTTGGGVPTQVWQVDIQPSSPNSGKPLWILDGQHRINGLARSQQRDVPLPVVLLLNQGPCTYSEPMLAKVFAQVTTEATPLTALHQEWLTFAFNLKSYSATQPHAAETTKAMRAVAELCRTPAFGGGLLPNPFYNKIRFNDHDHSGNPGPQAGGFRYDCVELKDLFLARYYNAGSNFGQHLDPFQLAEEFVRAFDALAKQISTPHDKSVFFGDSRHEQKIMQDAFIAGVLARILDQGPQLDWKTLLQQLKFPTTDWDFSSWVRSLNGSDGTNSRKLAIEVFATAFRSASLPSSQGDLCDYLRGNAAEVTFAFSKLSPAGGRPISRDRITLPVIGGSTLSQNIQSARHVRVAKSSGNIAKLELVDADSPASGPRRFRSTGFILEDGVHSKPLRVDVLMHHYGGIQKTATVSIRW
jgi:hypothetical protein